MIRVYKARPQEDEDGLFASWGAVERSLVGSNPAQQDQMTSNDKQIDVLMRRFAANAKGATVGEHLDADEVNTFAEGKLSPAARAHYLSHLADCSQCRKHVSDLAITSVAGARADTTSEKKEERSFWHGLTSWFALPSLRYAAFAAVALLVAGVAFIALRGSRQNRPNEMVARNDQVSQQPAPAVNSSENRSSQNEGIVVGNPTPMPRPPLPGDQTAKNEDTKTAGTTTATAPVMKDQPIEADKKAGLSELSPKPSYAPLPPGEQETAARQQSNVGGAGSIAGQQKVAEQKVESLDKLADSGRERDVAKEPAKPDDGNKALLSQTPAASRRAPAEKQKGGPNRGFENVQNQAVNQQRSESQTTGTGADNRKANDEEAPTRSVGGRKFRKQGGAWIDQKYKSSMMLISVSRESDDYNKLDSGLRSIAQQLGGQAIIVWKGKAYKIQ